MNQSLNTCNGLLKNYRTKFNNSGHASYAEDKKAVHSPYVGLVNSTLKANVQLLKDQ